MVIWVPLQPTMTPSPGCRGGFLGTTVTKQDQDCKQRPNTWAKIVDVCVPLQPTMVVCGGFLGTTVTKQDQDCKQ